MWGYLTAQLNFWDKCKGIVPFFNFLFLPVSLLFFQDIQNNDQSKKAKFNLVYISKNETLLTGYKVYMFPSYKIIYYL